MSEDVRPVPATPCPRCKEDAAESGWCGVCGFDLLPATGHPRFSVYAQSAEARWREDPAAAKELFRQRSAAVVAAGTPGPGSQEQRTALDRLLIAVERAAVLHCLAEEAKDLADRCRADVARSGIGPEVVRAALRDAAVPLTVQRDRRIGPPVRPTGTASAGGGMLIFYSESGFDFDGDGDVDGGLMDALTGTDDNDVSGGLLDGLQDLFG